MIARMEQAREEVGGRLAFDEATIDAIFRDLDQGHQPGAVVGIAIDGRPVYRKGFGLANMELPVKLSPAIRMRVGSITKHFTALAFLLLCEEGRARPDDPIRTYLPELRRVPSDVTVRHLMSHVSGLRDAKDICLQFSGPGKPVSSEDLLSLYRNIEDVNAAPGTAWCYNNGGYVMLGMAIERIVGEPLEDVIRKRILAPAGMNDTALRRWDTDFMPNSATLHMTKPGGGFEKSYLGIASAGEGGIVSTVDDMLRWLAHMSDPVVGSEETWRTIRSPYRLANGHSTGYSAGLISGQYRGVETLSHSGGVMGGNAHMVKVPTAALDVVVMVNRHDADSALLTNKILDACLTCLDPARRLPDRPLSIGVFRSPTTGRVIQLLVREGRQIGAIDGYEMRLEPDTDDWLRPAPPCSYLRQAIKVAGDPERPSSIYFTDFGNPDELLAVPPPDRADARPLVGRYRSDSTGTDAIISETKDGVQLRTVGLFGAVVNRLECLAEGIWQAAPIGVMPPCAILSFQGDWQGFRFSTLRTRSLPFRRCPSN